MPSMSDGTPTGPGQPRMPWEPAPTEGEAPQPPAPRPPGWTPPESTDPTTAWTPPQAVPASPPAGPAPAAPPPGQGGLISSAPSGWGSPQPVATEVAPGLTFADTPSRVVAYIIDWIILHLRDHDRRRRPGQHLRGDHQRHGLEPRGQGRRGYGIDHLRPHRSRVLRRILDRRPPGDDRSAGDEHPGRERVRRAPALAGAGDSPLAWPGQLDRAARDPAEPRLCLGPHAAAVDDHPADLDRDQPHEAGLARSVRQHRARSPGGSGVRRRDGVPRHRRSTGAPVGDLDHRTPLPRRAGEHDPLGGRRLDQPVSRPAAPG